MGSVNRREFIRRSGLATTAGTVALRAGNKVIWASAPGPASVAASDRVRIGVLGIGARAQQDAGSFAIIPGVEVVAASDVYKDRLVRAKELFGERLETTGD